MNEKVFYQDSRVTVTQSRIIVHGRTYVLSNITTISQYSDTKSTQKFISLIIALIAGMMFLLHNYLLMVILIGIALIVLLNSKSEYGIQVTTNSGESKVLKSKNYDYISHVTKAVNEAIIYRG